jgi:hypothetical protein
MDIYTNAAAWVTSYLMTNEYISTARANVAEYVSDETIQWALVVANQFNLLHLPEFLELPTGGPGIDEVLVNATEIALEITSEPGPIEGSADQVLIDALSELLDEKQDPSVPMAALAEEQREAQEKQAADIEAMKNEFREAHRDDSAEQRAAQEIQLAAAEEAARQALAQQQAAERETMQARLAMQEPPYRE